MRDSPWESYHGRSHNVKDMHSSSATTIKIMSLHTLEKVIQDFATENLTGVAQLSWLLGRMCTNMGQSAYYVAETVPSPLISIKYGVCSYCQVHEDF